MIHPLIQTVYGKGIKVRRIYEFFDEPMLFSAVNNKEEIFIFVLSDEFEDSRLWIVLQIGEPRLLDVERGNTSLFKAFSEPEDKILQKLIVPFDSVSPLTRTFLTPALVDKKHLPGEKAYLGPNAHLHLAGDSKLSDEFKPPIMLPSRTDFEIGKAKQYTPIEKSRKQEKIIANIVFFSGEEDKRPTIKQVGSTLVAFQDYVDASLYSKHNDIGTNSVGRVPKTFTQTSQLEAGYNYAGSYVIELLEGISDLSVKRLLLEVLSFFTKLMDSSTEEWAIKHVVSKSSRRVIYKLRNLLSTLVAIDSDVIFSWASPDGENQESFFTNKNIILALNVMGEYSKTYSDTFNFIGTLISGDVDARRFKIKSSDGEFYRGQFKDTFHREEHQLILGDIYKVVLEEEKSYNSTTEDENIKYFLIDLQPL